MLPASRLLLLGASAALADSPLELLGHSRRGGLALENAHLLLLLPIVIRRRGRRQAPVLVSGGDGPAVVRGAGHPIPLIGHVAGTPDSVPKPQ